MKAQRSDELAGQLSKICSKHCITIASDRNKVARLFIMLRAGDYECRIKLQHTPGTRKICMGLILLHLSND